MATEKNDHKAKLPRGLDPHNEKQVAKQLCYQIPGSKDSLYFILRGLGLPPAGEPGVTPRVEVDSKEYPTLWRTLDRLGVPHNGKQMVVKAESVARNDRKPSRRISSRGAAKARVSTPDASSEGAPRRPSEQSQVAGSADLLNAWAWLAEGAKTTTSAPAPCVPLPAERPPPWRASSAPKLSRARAKDLLDRLAVSKWPPRRPYSARNLLEELQKVQQQQKSRKSPAAGSMSVEEQQRYCEELAKPIPKPARYRQRHKFRRACSPVMVASQRASIHRLSRPRSAPLPGAPPQTDEQQEAAADRVPSRGQRLALSSPASEGCLLQREATPLSLASTGKAVRLEDAAEEPGRWLLEAMKRNAAAARAAEAASEQPLALKD